MPVVAVPIAQMLGALLAVAAIAKIRRFGAWRAALAGYRLVPARSAVAVAVPAAELAVAVGLLAGIAAAGWFAAALLAAFTLVLGAELASGSAPPACACLPWSGRPGRLTLVRNGVLGAAAVAAALGVRPHLGRGFWEASYVVLWLAVAALAVLVLALYRQVGVLHLRLGPRGALEEEGEGPELGAAIGHPAVPEGRAALVAFTSAGCPVCHQIVPGLRVLQRDPALAVVHAAYEEEDGPELHAAFDVPGTPYAVYLDAAGVVRAKGTVNTLEQLESLVAAGGSRAREAVGDVA
ncbi:MAG TPA: MauE/DoxX family redox-associated membrane protein [Gaiellales bacterium]|nr:MauE/DoxX family redox-associated membrane protein [Gaiellales bacterium]